MEIKIKEIADTFVDRLKNPFSGTLIIVLIFRHWSLIYSFFYFDPALSLEQRIKYVDHYINTNGLWYNLICPVFISIGLVVLYQVLSYVSKAIILFFKTWINPLIFKFIDRNKIVTKEELDIKRKEIIQIQAALIETNDRATKINSENQTLRGYNEELQKKYSEIMVENASLVEGIQDNQNDINEEDYNKVMDALTKYKRITDIQAMFIDAWRANWKFRSTGVVDSEDVYVEDNNFYADGTLAFVIDMVEIKDNKMKFRKRSLIDNRILLNDLLIVNSKRYEGTEVDINNPQLIIDITYSKVKSFSNETLKKIESR